MFLRLLTSSIFLNKLGIFILFYWYGYLDLFKKMVTFQSIYDYIIIYWLLIDVWILSCSWILNELCIRLLLLIWLFEFDENDVKFSVIMKLLKSSIFRIIVNDVNFALYVYFYLLKMQDLLSSYESANEEIKLKFPDNPRRSTENG